MAMTTSHQRNILEIKKSVDILIYTLNYPCLSIYLNSILWPSPFKDMVITKFLIYVFHESLSLLAPARHINIISFLSANPQRYSQFKALILMSLTTAHFFNARKRQILFWKGYVTEMDVSAFLVFPLLLFWGAPSCCWCFYCSRETERHKYSNLINTSTAIATGIP
jgi:hypothetical protein